MIEIKKFYSILSAIIFFISIIFYIIYSETLIIYWNRNRNNNMLKTEIMGKKKSSLFYWNNNNWHKEDVEIISGENKIKSITNLIEKWLNLLEEENITEKKIILQTILIDHSNTLYISFAQPIFKKQASTYSKLLWIHGLLKTIKSNTSIQHILFLIQHKPIIDKHIDFSQPWPVSGYM